jgi:hypothetical protein
LIYLKAFFRQVRGDVGVVDLSENLSSTSPPIPFVY